MKQSTDQDMTRRAGMTGHRQTLPDALSIGERVRRATLAATALHMIEMIRHDGDRREGGSASQTHDGTESAA